MKNEYDQIEKQKVRDEALKFAIRTLTKNRFKSSIARKSYVRDIKNHLQIRGTILDHDISSLLSEEEIIKWELFYESTIRKKKPHELRVAYLSGPNPENDIEVLVENGIASENIWAFESEKKIYSKAITSLLNSRFPFIKIYRGKIENYLKIIPFKFDIIYLDFCTTIGSDKTLSVIRDIFYYQKLDTLGVLITNFSLPSKNILNNKSYREDLNIISANYLYPKPFTEKHTGLGGGIEESTHTNNISKEDFYKIAKRNEKTFYSQFITRILFDLPSVIIPYQRLANNEMINKLFFKNFNEKSIPFDSWEELFTFPETNPILWSMFGHLINTATSYNLFIKILKQLSISANEEELIKNIRLVSYFMTDEHQENLHSNKLESIRTSWKSFTKYIFCDVFMFHQLKDILVGQLTSPYFYNVNFTKRWMYKAKENEMFMDLVTYDECRYIFDWMPTLDMFEEGVDDWNRQLALRFAMDSVSKQRRFYNEEFFSGTAVVDQRTKTFEAKELKKRKIIK